jgi:type II secretory pathway predicted ATPase ExeA
MSRANFDSLGSTAVNHDKSLARIHREFRMVSKIFNMTGLLGSGQLVAVPDG